MLTREYLFDVSTARDDQEHSYAWMIHTFGKAKPDAANPCRKSDDLAELVGELSDVCTLTTGYWFASATKPPNLTRFRPTAKVSRLSVMRSSASAAKTPWFAATCEK